MPPTTPSCRHLHADGRQCGSPALRGEPFCFYHHTSRKPMPKRETDSVLDPQLPAPDDFLAIQRGIGEILRLLATDRIPDRRAATLLKGLAIASANLARHHRREEKLAAQAEAAHTPAPAPVTGYINDPTHGTLALDPDDDNQQSTPNSLQPVPDPIPVFTPDPSRATSYDQAMFTEIHQKFAAHFRDKLQQFEHKKSLELEDLYDTRYTNLEADFEARFQTRVAQLQAELQQLPSPREVPSEGQTSPQQNQGFRTSEQNLEHRLALAS